MTSYARRRLPRYLPSAGAGAVAIVLCRYPALLAPLARLYLALCERVLDHLPVGHHVPPLLVAAASPLLVGLGGGLGVALARELSAQRQLGRDALARWRPPDAELARLTRRLRAEGRIVTTSDESVYAFCGGLLRARVYLSRGLLRLLAPAELEAVVRHELHHARRHDPLRFFVSDLARRLACVFPILGVLDQRVRVSAEVTADRAALSAVAMEDLAGALVKVLRASATGQPPARLAALSPTTARIRALNGEPINVPVDWRDVLVSAIVALLFVCMLSWLAMHPGIAASPAGCGACASL